MKDIFILEKNKAKEYIIIRVEIIIQEIGIMNKKKDLEKCIGQIKEKHTKVIGKTICLMVLVNNNGKKKVEI